jgi:hypothetical protein
LEETSNVNINTNAFGNSQTITNVQHQQQLMASSNLSNMQSSEYKIDSPDKATAPNLNQSGGLAIHKQYVWENCLFGRVQFTKQPDFQVNANMSKSDAMRIWLNTKFAAFSSTEIIRNAENRLGPRAIHEIIALGLQGHISISGNNANKQVVRDEKIHPIDPLDRASGKTIEINVANLIYRVTDFVFYDSAMSAKKSKIPGALSVSRIMMSYASLTFGLSLLYGLWSNGQFDVGLLGVSNTTFIASAHVGPATRLANIAHAIEFNNALKQNLPNQRSVPAYNLLALSWISMKSSILPLQNAFPASMIILFIFELYTTLYYGMRQDKLINAIQVLSNVQSLQTGYFYEHFGHHNIDLGGVQIDKESVGIMSQINAGVINARIVALKDIIIGEIIQRKRYRNNDNNNNKKFGDDEIKTANEDFNNMNLLERLGALVHHFQYDNWFDSRSRSKVQATLEVSQAFYNLSSTMGFNVQYYKVIETDPNSISNMIASEEINISVMESNIK